MVGFDFELIALSLKLGFKVIESAGRLSIKLNGEEIFNNEVLAKNIEPIKLRKDLLQQENVLEFAVSDIGVKFWGANKYTISNILITADSTDVTSQVSRQIFITTKAELSGAEKAVFNFIPECNYRNIGPLEISFNGLNIYKGVPDCGSENIIELDPSVMLEGQNTLIFQSTQGSYVIGKAVVTTTLEGAEAPIYYFHVNPQLYLDIEEGNIAPFLYLTFSSQSETTAGKVLINGHPTNVEAGETVFRKNIAPFIVPGSNVIEIVPRKEMNVARLEVRLE